MKRKLTLFFLLPLLVSCSKSELRSDIAKFIKGFSLEKAMEEYVEGSYVSIKTQTSGNETNKEIVNFDYSLADNVHPLYRKVNQIYEGEELKEEKINEIVYLDDEMYLSQDGEKSKISLSQAKSLINEFFYKVTLFSGTYHAQGMYYGDYIKEVVGELQNYVTIDQEHELYIMAFSVTENLEGVEVKSRQTYSVNKVGMLVTNHLSISSPLIEVVQDINVYNYTSLTAE